MKVLVVGGGAAGLMAAVNWFSGYRCLFLLPFLHK